MIILWQLVLMFYWGSLEQLWGTVVYLHWGPLMSCCRACCPWGGEKAVRDGVLSLVRNGIFGSGA